MSLISAMLTSAGALDAYSQVLSVTENNVVNASTPGFAKQTQCLDAERFDATEGFAGGVIATDVQSSRNDFDEQAVREQTTLLGAASQNVASLTSLQSNFDISGSSGIPSALNGLFQAFSGWGQSPGDANSQQTVINDAASVAGAFQDAANGLAQATQDTNVQLQSTVNQVNQMAGQLAQYNSQIMAGDRNDPGLDAQLHSTMEQLSQYVSFTAIKQSDGSYTILVDGQTPLVFENKSYGLSCDLEQPTDPPPGNPNGPPAAHIHAADGTDITADITTGQLGALLNVRNTVLPSYIGDGSQQGDLNTMAQQFADRVNQLLTHGTSTDPTVTSGGVPLFTYDSSDVTNVAASLAVNPQATVSTLVAADPATQVVNGIPLALSNLADPTDPADMIGGKSYTEFYGDMATRVGNGLNTATSEQTVQQSAVAQAQSIRQQDSGVSLDEEAMTLVQFQQAYEASSQMITVLNQLTQSVINILGTAN